MAGQVTHNGSISANPSWSYNNVSQGGGTSVPYVALADITSTATEGQSGVNTASGSFTSPSMSITGPSTVNFQGRTYNSYCDPTQSNDILVEYSEDGGSSFASLGIFEPTSSTLTSYSVDLPANTIGQDDIQVRFSSVQPSSSTNGSTCVPCAATTGPCLIKTVGVDNVSINNALPVSFIYFRGLNKEARVLLAFSTATEHNNAYFDIERSADGRSFRSIGRVQGSGTSARLREYSFEDKAPLRGINYYRLRQVDFGGSFEYSPVISVENGRSRGITLVAATGNPRVQGRFEEQIPMEGMYQVMDYSGRVLVQGILPAETTDFSFDTSGWAAGVYIVRTETGQAIDVQRFMR